MTATSQLTTDLQKLVLEVEDDLRDRLEADVSRKQSWQDEHKHAVEARRTAMSWSEWRDDRIVQAAVSWVLTTVFVRFAEDNALISKTWFTGPAERRYHAVEAQQQFFREHPERTDREWIEDSFQYLRSMPATAGLVDEHAALQLVSPSAQMAGRILEFWRQVDDQGSLLHDLADPTLSTRFLGDLYQDLSEHARENFALLQTPEFVEEFILDQTLTPALEERSLEGFKLIDPTCGSGHFLLGAFSRFNELWSKHAPTMPIHARVQEALDSVYGVDINAFAVAVARFRLTIAALQECGECSLESGSGFEIHVETGDSLIYGKAPDMFEGFSDGTGNDLFAYATEDQRALKKILGSGQYDVVVGNPPYITVKDKSLNARYRELYDTCKGTYALSVPFMERFFDLARPHSSDRPAGWTGQITSNSFMRREFGTKVINNFLITKDLRAVIDTSGAYIPGHGTPTVILIGRNDRPVGGSLRAVLGIRGEPGRPADPAKGVVWNAISTHFDEPDYQDEFISVVNLDREILASHPWSLQGGSAGLVLQHLEMQPLRLGELLKRPIGGAIRAGADDVFMRITPPPPNLLRYNVNLRPLVLGENVRDWELHTDNAILFPYEYGTKERSEDELPKLLWPWRNLLANRSTFQGDMADAGRVWWEYMQYTPGTYETPYALVFAFVATHNHFVLDRGGKVFNRSAPVIKLPESSNEEDYLRLLGVLNSSVACFWLKQNSHNKGAGGGSSRDERWRDFYEFTGTVLKNFPIPEELNTDIPLLLDELASKIGDCSPNSVVASGVPSRSRLDIARAEEERTRAEMVFLQEELDWFYYHVFGLLDVSLNYEGPLQQIAVGGRPFEEILRERVSQQGYVTKWFSEFAAVDHLDLGDNHDYASLIRRRLETIRNNRMVRWLESPDFKRDWSVESWEKREERALRSWLLERVESRAQWFDREGRPSIRSVGQLADSLGRDTQFMSVLDLWAGQRDVEPVSTLTKLLADEAVPYSAAWRLKSSGLQKFEDWTVTWDLQRREDNGEEVGSIPVPPKYTKVDFTKPSYWSHRGKLDVPKERFILYPEAGLSKDKSMYLGWAGWDHAEQFLALAAHMDRMIADGAEDNRLIPILAGLHELAPWVKQWHSDIDPNFGVSLGDFCEEQLEQRRATLGVSYDDLDAWRPPKRTGGRKAKA